MDQRAGARRRWCRSSQDPRPAATPTRAWPAPPARRPPRSSASWRARRAAAADLSNAAGGTGPRHLPGATTACSWSTGPTSCAAARSAVEEGTLDQAVVDDIGWARYPRVFADQPSAPPLGGANLGIGAYSKHPDLAVALVECVNADAEGHPVHARRGRAVAVRGVLRRPRGPGEVPERRPDPRVDRRGRPPPADAVLRRRRRRDHPDLASAGLGDRRHPRSQTNSWPTCWREGDCCDGDRRTGPSQKTHRARRSSASGSRGERRLGMYLTLPSYIVMILVTAYPLVYALVLSLYNYRLTDPAGPHVRRAEQLRGDPDRPGVVERLRDHAGDHRRHRRDRTGARLLLRLRDAAHHPGPRSAAHGDPDPLRHRHRGVGVHLALRLRDRLGLRQPVAQPRRLRLVRRPLVGASS